MYVICAVIFPVVSVPTSVKCPLKISASTSQFLVPPLALNASVTLHGLYLSDIPLCELNISGYRIYPKIYTVFLKTVSHTRRTSTLVCTSGSMQQAMLRNAVRVFVIVGVCFTSISFVLSCGIANQGYTHLTW